MSYITWLEIENFQSHEHTVVSLGGGLNVIVGPSDYGKSAVVRALRWLLFNEPRGADFIRVGARTCRVTAELDDGTRVTRMRSGKENRYILKHPDQEEQVFEGFGGEIPQEILLATGVRKVVIDDRNRVELSLGSQLEGPFLLEENGAVRAKVIGQLGGVHLLDWAQKATVTDLRRLREEEGQLTAGVQSLEEALHAYDHLPGLHQSISRLEGLLQRATELESRITELETLKRSYEEIEASLSRLAGLLSALEPVAAVERLLPDLELWHHNYRSLQELEGDWLEVGRKLAAIEEMLSALERTDALETGLNRLEVVFRHYGELTALNAEIDLVTARLCLADDLIRETRGVPQAEELVNRLEALNRQLADLSRVEGDLQVVEADLASAGKVIAATSRLDQAEECLNRATETVRLGKAVQELWISWQELQKSYQGACLAADSYQAELERRQQEYRAVLIELGRCPVCFGELTPEAIARALAEYD